MLAFREAKARAVLPKAMLPHLCSVTPSSGYKLLASCSDCAASLHVPLRGKHHATATVHKQTLVTHKQKRVMYTQQKDCALPPFRTTRFAYMYHIRSKGL